MSAASLLVRLYPPAVRARWATEISREVSESGVRSWPDTVAGAVRLWLRPSEWPETPAGQTRRVLVVALFAVTAAGTLVLRAATPSATLTADVHHPLTSLWLAPVLLGMVLAAPLPTPRWRTVCHLTAVTVRTLAAPALAVSAMCLTAWSGVVDDPSATVDVVAVAGYWGVLGFTAVRACALVARVARTATMPTTRRLRMALLIVGVGLALAVGQSLLVLVRAAAAPEAGTLAVSAALSVLAAAAISVGRDLRGVSV